MERRAWVWWLSLAGIVAGTMLLHGIWRMHVQVRTDDANPTVPFLGRYAIGTHQLLKNVQPEQAERSGAQLLESLDRTARSPVDRVRVVPVVAEIRGAEAALQRIGALRGERGLTSGLRRDLETLQEIYGEAGADDAARARLVERHAWFGRLAASFGLDAGAPERRRVIGAASRTMTLVIAGMVAGALAFVAGLVLFVLGLVRWAGGRLQTRYEPPPKGGDTRWLETIVIFLLLTLVLQAVPPMLGVDLGPWISVALWALLLVALWPRWRGASWEEWRLGTGLHRGRGVLAEIGWGIVGYLAVLPLFVVGLLITAILVKVFGQPVSHPIVEEAAGASAGRLVAVFLSACVWAPVAEETMFRGAFYRYLRSRTETALAAAGVGVLFGLVHPQGLAAVPALAMIGAGFALLRQWRGSLVAPMTAHALHNGVLVTFAVTAMG